MQVFLDSGSVVGQVGKQLFQYSDYIVRINDIDGYGSSWFSKVSFFKLFLDYNVENTDTHTLGRRPQIWVMLPKAKGGIMKKKKVHS